MARGDIWYHLYPLGFLGAETQNPAAGAATDEWLSHRLVELTHWLDYFVELGVTGLLLGPVFESESHGYDIVDPLRIDRRLGTLDDLHAVIDGCRQRSLRIALDVVLNHVGRGHPYFQDVLTRRRDSAWADWFHIDFDKPGHDGFSYANFEGHGGLATLNHANPQVLQWAAEGLEFWIAQGVDAFRLDAAYAIPSRFLAELAARLRPACPQLLLIGETIHGDYPATVAAAGLDSATQYELWKAIWSSLNDRNFFELAHALQRHAGFCQHFAPWNFLGNHDTTRILTKLRDPRHAAHALAILVTSPGMPAIYAGDEQGVRGTKYDRPEGDAEIRQPPPQRPEEVLGNPPPIWQLHRELLTLRRQRPWLADGRMTVPHLTNGSIGFEVRSRHNLAFVALCIEDAPTAFPVPPGLEPAAGDAMSAADGRTLPAHGWGIWSTR